MILTDTHSHIYSKAFDPDRDQVVERAIAAGVKRIMLPAIDSESHERMMVLAERYPEVMFPMMGLHPTSVNDNPRWRDELAAVEKHLAAPPIGRFWAVGEIGMDFYWSTDFLSEQTEAFEAQIALAHKHSLPMVIHVRNAMRETIEILERHRHLGLRGVMHSWSGTADDYRKVKELGDFVFGIGGVVTFKNGGLAEMVEAMDIGDIVLETDSPYLTPAPHRGKRNESAYVRLVCNKVAEIKALHPDTVAQLTTDNAARIFGI